MDLRVRALFSTTFRSTDRFLPTVGFVAIVIALLAILGLASRSGWLTRLAGALGLVEFVLFGIQVYRAPGNQRIGVGAWVMLVGAVVAMIGGFFGARREVVGPAGTTTVVEE